MQIWRVLLTVMLFVTLAAPRLAVAAKPVNKLSHVNATVDRRERSKLHVVSDAAIIVVQGTGETLFEKNAGEKKAIASITKLMTAMVVLDSKQSLDALITISREDVDMQRGSTSRLRVGVTLPRKEMLKLALMASENRAAFALARNYRGGVEAFVAEMNRTAATLGMRDTIFYGPTGLDVRNVSTARDLAVMVNAAYGYDHIRNMSTSTSHLVRDNSKKLTFRNTNRLVKNKSWKIGLSKTGYISDSGKCLVMQATFGKTRTVIILLDSWGSRSRIVDAMKIKRWLERGRSHKS